MRYQERYSRLDRLLQRLAFASPEVWKALADVEDRLYARRKPHADEPFARRYMADVGRFAFGANFRPMDFGHWLPSNTCSCTRRCVRADLCRVADRAGRF